MFPISPAFESHQGLLESEELLQGGLARVADVALDQDVEELLHSREVQVELVRDGVQRVLHDHDLERDRLVTIGLILINSH